MNTSPDILRLRVLLCFLSEDESASTVTGISRTLGEEKYKITRILSSLEQEKLIDKTNPRNPKLTEYGLQEAKKYDERIATTLNHLIYEGLDTESAYHDALYWSLYSTDKSMQVIRATENQYRVKYALKNRASFSGSFFCRHIKDGTYHFPFVIYREQIENKSNISDANGCFEHPCTLIVNDGIGIIKVRAITAFAYDKRNCKKIQNIQYFDGNELIRAEKSADIFSLSADALSFINIGKDAGQILHGSICLKIQYTEQNEVAEDTAIFTILI